MKILINYLQTISIIKSLRLNWHEVWAQFFVIQGVVSGGAGMTLNLECLIEGFLFKKKYTIFCFRFPFSDLL